MLQDQIHLKLCFITGDMEAGNLGGWVAEICRDHHQVMSGEGKEDIRGGIRLKAQRCKRASLQWPTTAEFLSDVPWLQSIFKSNSELSKVIASLVT